MYAIDSVGSLSPSRGVVPRGEPATARAGRGGGGPEARKPPGTPHVAGSGRFFVPNANRPLPSFHLTALVYLLYCTA